MSSTSVKDPDKSGKLSPLVRRRKIALMDRGVSVASVARSIEPPVSRQFAWTVLHGVERSRRVEEAFAAAIGEPVDELFPPTEGETE